MTDPDRIFHVPQEAQAQYNALRAAVQTNKTDKTRQLLHAWRWKCNEGLQILLTTAIIHGNVETVKLLLNCGFDYTDKYQSRMYNCPPGKQFGHESPLDRNPIARFVFCRSNLVEAASKGCIPIFELMLEQRWDVNEDLGMLGDALTIALRDLTMPRRHDAARWLLQHGAKPDRLFMTDSGNGVKLDQCRGSSLVLACSQLDTPPDIIRLLLAKGALVNGTGALHAAARENNVMAMDILVNEGRADVDRLQHGAAIYQYTALHRAAAAGSVESVRFLLEHGARKDLRNSLCHTARDAAQFRGHLECVAALED